MSFFGSIYADPDLPHRARTVYMYLRDRAGGGSCWPGVKTIARDLHLSPRTVQRALNDLERAGYIQRQRRHRENGSCTSNLYIINMDGQIATRTLPAKGNVRAFAVTSAVTPRRSLKGQL